MSPGTALRTAGRPSTPHLPAVRGTRTRMAAHPVPAEDTYGRTLPRVPAAAAAARRLTASALHSWNLSVLEDAAAAVVTELVANAVRHARRDVLRVTLILTRGSEVRITVSDLSRVLPQGRAASPGDDSGRGLAIVDALCEGRWGADIRSWGKQVWADLPTVPDE